MGLLLSDAGKIMTRNGKLFVDTNGTDCCCGTCCAEIPDTIYAEITDIHPDCDCALGNKYTLTRVAGTDKWTGGGTFCDRDIDISFCCGLAIIENNPQGMYLGAAWDPSCPSDVTLECNDAEMLSPKLFTACDPLEVEFEMGFTPLCCGQADAADAIVFKITDV